jgi:hypothetical protein
MPNSIVSNGFFPSKDYLRQILNPIKNSETPNYFSTIGYLESLESKGDYPQQVLSVITWFHDYYDLCDENNGEKEFIRQHLDQIIESFFPKKVLDTLWLLHYYGLHKSQEQLNAEFLSLKNLIDLELGISVEPYLDDLLKNEHCKSLTNILAVLNINQLLTKENLTNLLNKLKININYELLEKCLVKLNNKLFKGNHSKFQNLFEESFFRLDKTTNLEKIIRTFSTSSQKDISAIKPSCLLDQLGLLTADNINDIKKEPHEEITSSLITLLENKNGLQKLSIPSIPSAPKISITPDPILLHSHIPHSVAKHPNCNPPHKPTKRSAHWKLSSRLINWINQLIKKWREHIENSKHQKCVYQEYQRSIKKLSEQTDIHKFSHILCDIGLLYGKKTPLPKKNLTIDQLIRKFSEPNPRQTQVLEWLNSYYRNGKPDEKEFIQQQLDNILKDTEPKKALHAISMLYYCNLHAEKQIKAILASDKAHDFIALFLEKLHSPNGKHVESLKKEVEASLQQLNAPPTIAITSKVAIKKLEATRIFQPESEQTKHGTFFTLKTSEEIRRSYLSRIGLEQG